MTYQEFVDFCLAFAWREGDLDLENHIHSIITMANADLRSSLKTKEREVMLEASLDTSSYTLGDDVYNVKHVITPLGEHRRVSFGELADYMSHRSNDEFYKLYSIVGNRIILPGPYREAHEAGNPMELVLVYNSKVPEFRTTDQSWLTSENLDLYVYTVMKHACVYLREDERLQSWAALQTAALESVNESDAWERETGIQADVPLPHLIR